MTPVIGAGAVGLIAIALYAIFGGADFGGGVWDLFATGPRRGQQRDAISEAIGPVWESNHVWLIFAVVVLFTCFPPAFADLSIGLYAPLSFALVGIVLRGSAFVFRNFASDAPILARTWTVVFGIASLITPFFLGDAVGALASGRYAWTSPFAASVGVFAVTVCAQVAAVFLLAEVRDAELLADFRKRAIRATFGVWLLGIAPAAIARVSEPQLFATLQHPAALPGIAIALVAGIVVVVSVVQRRVGLARIAVSIEALAILGGWFGAQAPELIPGRFTYTSAAASDAMLVAFLVAAAIGALLLIPSLLLLFRMFKSSPANLGPDR